MLNLFPHGFGQSDTAGKQGTEIADGLFQRIPVTGLPCRILGLVFDGWVRLKVSDVGLAYQVEHIWDVIGIDIPLTACNPAPMTGITVNISSLPVQQILASRKVVRRLMELEASAFLHHLPKITIVSGGLSY